MKHLGKGVTEFTVETDLIKTVIAHDLVNNQFLVKYFYKDGGRAGSISIEGSPGEYERKGGTKLYCPSCKATRKCMAGGISTLSDGDGKFRNWYKVDHSDIHWFRRIRMCRTCFYTFVTAEVQEDFLDELVALRNKLIRGEKVDLGDLKKYGDNVIPFKSE